MVYISFLSAPSGLLMVKLSRDMLSSPPSISLDLLTISVAVGSATALKEKMHNDMPNKIPVMLGVDRNIAYPPHGKAWIAQTNDLAALCSVCTKWPRLR
jgi:hypothetical protein